MTVDNLSPTFFSPNFSCSHLLAAGKAKTYPGTGIDGFQEETSLTKLSKCEKTNFAKKVILVCQTEQQCVRACVEGLMDKCQITRGGIFVVLKHYRGIKK